MKKTLISIGIAVLALGIPFGIVRAVETPVSTSSTEQKPAENGIVLGLSADATVAERKLAAETQLRDIADKLGLFASRTQLALNRLASKGIDTVPAQTELTATMTTLATAKTNLDLFTKLTITEDADTTPLKEALKTIETNLADTRTHLINALTALKAAVSISVE